MKTITMYELLGLVKDGKAPKKIRFNNMNWNKRCGKENTYYINDNGSRDLFVYFFTKNLTFNLNDEVEILEEKKKFTKEDFIKEAMDLEDITREEFNKRYEVKEYNCGRKYCKGFIKVGKVQEEKKIPEKINKSYDIRILDLDKPHSIKDYDMEQLIEMVQDIYEKQGEICDYLKSKGDE